MIGGFYYTMSPYQNCIRAIDKRIEDVRNQLATETDVTKRDELELENKDLISQKKSECSCLLYTSDAADDSLRVDLGGRRII